MERASLAGPILRGYRGQKLQLRQIRACRQSWVPGTRSIENENEDDDELRLVPGLADTQGGYR